MSGAKAVREDRLWQRHADMAKLGGTQKGGVNRQALSPEDAAARNLLASWAKARGFAIFTDAIGNLFVRREGSEPGASPVMSGSHMDSQPTGGRFDGMYGVLAAFEALEALEDAGLRTRRPLIAVAWTNEEGSRFQPGAMGSAVFAGRSRLDDMLAVKDWKGVVLKEALAETLKAAPAPMRDGTPGFPLDGYVEVAYRAGPAARERAQDHRRGHRHPGQPALHRRDRWATRRMPARRRAPPARTPSPPPRASPRRCTRRRPTPTTRCASPSGGSRSIPARPTPCRAKRASPSTCAIPSDAVLEAHEQKLLAIVASRAAPCTARIDRVTAMAPTDFDPHVIDLVRAKADALELGNMDMPSGAGHDAMHIARLCPAGMIFVPCERGISHNEIENATPADLAAGARVLVEVLVRTGQSLS